MAGWRFASALGLLLLVGLPISIPFWALVSRPDTLAVWGERGRILSLASITLALSAATVLIALPCGLVVAVLLYPTDLPPGNAFRFLALLSLFVPLPLLASAWQAALGIGGWTWHLVPFLTPQATASDAVVWTPWVSGLGAAASIHAMAAIPWVILLVGHGLRWVDRDCEEDLLTFGSPLQALWHV